MTTEQKFNCIFCKDVFDCKEELQIHFRKHGDPNFKTNSRFLLEAIEPNEKVKEKAEMVSCDACSQMFPTISKAVTHKHRMHPDHVVKYFCPWCGKLFTMKHPYNIHIQTSHVTQKRIDDKLFHCDCCDVDFFLPAAMLYHNKFFHRQESDITDIGSSKKLRTYNQETLQLYYCAFCGEEYENQVNLIKHTTDDHSDENQFPGEVLRCPLCEAIFYHLDAYEIHMSFHSTNDFYGVKNELFENLLEFSLETVPPLIEIVKNTEDMDNDGHSQDTDAESTANTLGIEQFLELAMEQAGGNGEPGKVKKKKHKKSKKTAAITLDEFLNMNQDVFGEGLHFQGVEEVPTRVVAKQLKNKKSTNTAASAELEKLKEKGIVVMKVNSKSPNILRKNLHNKEANKPTQTCWELKTSSEVLTQLINQSNNQIRIVKRSSVNKNDSMQIQNSTEGEKNADEMESQRKYENTNPTEITCTKPDDLSIDNRNKLSSKTEVQSKPTTTADAVQDNAVDKTTQVMHHEVDTDDVMGIHSNNTLETDLEQSPKIQVSNTSLKPVMDENDEELTENNQSHDEPDHEESDFEKVDNHNVSDEDKDEHNDEIQTPSDKNKAQPSISQVANSLSTLKHLSHLTVKPINQNKNTTTDTTIDRTLETKRDQKPPVKKEMETSRQFVCPDIKVENTAKSKSIVDNDPTLDALKMLSKNITIKSLPTSTKRNIDETESDDEDKGEAVTQEPTNNIKLTDVSANKNVIIKKIKLEKEEPTLDIKDVNCNKNITIKKIKTEKKEPSMGIKKKDNLSNSVKNTSNIVNKVNTSTTEIKLNKTDADKIPTNDIKPNYSNILKNLPNITTKPVNKTAQPQDAQQANTKQNEAEIIEISDIDDSDEEAAAKKVETKQEDTKITYPLKNLSKHITVKSLCQPVQPLKKNIKIEKVEEPDHDEDQNHMFDSDDDVPINTKVCSQKLSSRNMAFKNALKNLGQNITVKARTSSSQSVITQDHNSHESNMGEDNEVASDSDCELGKVKITEMDDDNLEDNMNENFDDDHPNDNDNNPIVESPHDSGSEHDEIDDSADFESEIKATALLKPSSEITPNKNNACLNNLKNISNSITIKSVNSNSIDKQTRAKPTQFQENLDMTKNQTKQLAIKSSRPTVKETLNENTSNSKNFKNMCKVVDHTSNESMNQKVSVNKEVTVKTFQTKTVIQEITTTVTKTIKTVNQTVNKQESRNSNQKNIPVLPQRVLGMRPPNTTKNLQGVVIRHAAPVTVRPNKAGATPRAVGTFVRPSKQIVSMRPGLNVTRPSTPRMPSVKTNLPQSSPNKPVVGRPLKFSPSVLTSTNVKRPNSDEISGPFSCFKKAKESLIPVSDVPEFGGGDSTVQMNAASHTSTSNYTSTSKIVKGNSIVTATQMKSEVTSMQQFSRQGAIGTKVKNAQVKQMQVQEKSESSGMQRTTLAAIEKLQKQGLLVKKPREVNENSDFDHIDDNVDYSSNYEHGV